MRRFFRHELFVKLLAALALMLCVFIFLVPKIADYNSAVKDEQIELLIKANGNSNGVIHFSGCNPCGPSLLDYAEIVVPFGLFLSLFLTRKIFFSFLSVFVYIFEFIVIYKIFVANVEFPYSYFYNYPLSTAFFVITLLALSHWQAAIICRFGRQIFQSPKNLK